MIFDDTNLIKVYVQVFNDDGVYSGVWQDITRYVLSLGNTGIQIDSSDYNLGVFQNSNLPLTINNRDGRFNDVGTDETLFVYKRRDSLIKITYQIKKSQCGIVTVPFLQGEEVTVFKGLLNDESLRTSAEKEDAKFIVLGFEAILDRVLVNFSSLNDTDTVEEILYTILNQTEITGLLNVSAANINVGLDQESDAVASLEGLTVREAVDELLLISNSILYIDENDNIIISDRSPSSTSQATFYGQASDEGAENIIDINNYNNGLHRVFNYFLWDGSTLSSKDNDSIDENGVRKVTVNSDIFTNTTKQSNFMDELLAEFKDKKIEFEMMVPLTYQVIGLTLLDKINVDYPIPLITLQDEDIPLIGAAIIGEAVLPYEQWSLEIDIDTDFKILQKLYDFNNYKVLLKLREV